MARSKARSAAGRSSRNAAPDTRLEQIEEELERWRAEAIPDATAPLEAEDVARLVRDLLMFIDVAEAAESFSVNTVHYYRRKDIIDEPEGRTVAARYAVRHVWQAAGARLAGFLGLVTLAEARDALRGASADEAHGFVAARTADARARAAIRESTSTSATLDDVRPLSAAPPSSAPLDPASAMTARVIGLPGNAMCLIPSGHGALRSSTAARALVTALARELGVDSLDDKR